MPRGGHILLLLKRAKVIQAGSSGISRRAPARGPGTLAVSRADAPPAHCLAAEPPQCLQCPAHQPQGSRCLSRANLPGQGGHATELQAQRSAQIDPGVSNRAESLGTPVLRNPHHRPPSSGGFGRGRGAAHENEEIFPQGTWREGGGLLGLMRPLCDIPSGCCSFTGPWTVTRSSLRMLRRVAAFCRPLWPVLLLVSFPRSRSPVVGVLGLC